MLLPAENLDRVLGDRTAKAFAKHLGLKTVADLLQHFPRRYSSRGELTPIAQIPIGETVTVVADIQDVRERRIKGKAGSILEIRITDGEAVMSLTFFNQAWRAKVLRPGMRGLFAGKTSVYNGQIQLAHPDYELFPESIDDEQAKAWAELPIPIYSASSVVTTWMIQRAMGIVLDTLKPIEDPLPPQLVAQHELMSADSAIRNIHRPAKASDWIAARDTLRYHEAFTLQATLLRRKLLAATEASTPRVATADGVAAAFDASLPFTLTSGQIAVGEEIAGDLAKPHPMHRLLQGEVGSGKTLVALRAMLVVADAGGQSALLAPTEVLAAQHFASIERTLGPQLANRIGLTLLTGQMGAAEKKRALLQIVSGKAQIVVGTHALIADAVSFFDLGLIVVDEQHRFGVEQREALRLKGKLPPHVLTMTATPIPRTLAVTVFGDLEVSTLTELPGGRRGISTHVVREQNPAHVARVWTRVAEEVAAGRQAFVVCPRIDGDDAAEDSVEPEFEESVEDAAKPKRPLAAAVAVAEALKSNPAVAGLRIGLLHGRQSTEEKARVMGEFAAGLIDVLVSTTVIEVGVDVPNSTVMVVLDAERFGISQLHQLRGRVGRGGHAGLCLLLTSAEDGSLALERLEAVASTTDGFKLSEVDLELRREGDVLGSTQSGGRSALKLLRVVRDAQLIQSARADAAAILDGDPTLERHELLAEDLARIDAAQQENLAKS